MNLIATVYVRPNCSYCSAALTLLQRSQINLHVIDIRAAPGRLQEMYARSGQRTFPQIFLGDRHVGGWDDLLQMERQGGLPVGESPASRG